MLKEIHEQPQASRTRSRAASPTATSSPRSSASVREGPARAHATQCTSSRAARATTPAWSRATGSNRSRAFRAHVDIASEYRYRDPVVRSPTRCSSPISQSGETADTLAALKLARAARLSHTLAICNVPESSIVREIRARAHDARRPGDRRRIDESLHHAADRARCSRSSSAKCTSGSPTRYEALAARSSRPAGR